MVGVDKQKWRFAGSGELILSFGGLIDNENA
jgi:hypothetical protein